MHPAILSALIVAIIYGAFVAYIGAPLFWVLGLDVVMVGSFEGLVWAPGHAKVAAALGFILALYPVGAWLFGVPVNFGA